MFDVINVDGILEPVVGEINELGEYKYDGYVRFYPMFDIDGIIYSGSPSQPKTYVLVSGYTNVDGTTATGGSAKLYQKIGDFDYDVRLNNGTEITKTFSNNLIHPFLESGTIKSASFEDS